jgi:hypothetical protein
VLWLLLVLASAHTTMRPQAHIDTDQTSRQTIEDERDCGRDDWKFAFLAQSSGVLKSDSLPTHSCRAVSLAWCRSAKIVQLTGVRQIDVFVSVTLVRVSEDSPMRVVRALGGLVQNRDLEDAKSNKAVFNELLQTCRFKPQEGKMLEVAALYLFMVGHPPDETSRRLSETMTISDILGTVKRKGKWTTVNVRQRHSSFGPFGNPSRNWVLKFRNRKSGVQLLSVMPE